ncbi:MAG: alanine racemase [Candidatus Omnitrophica bacterium]|nr:alanine racemase [Candidatus Omnitrophota bacterium]
MISEFNHVSSFKTPFFFYDFDKVHDNIRRFSYFPKSMNVELFYAMKANDYPPLLTFLKQKGIHIEVASGLELQMAQKVGFDKIVFNGPAKTNEELELAAKSKNTTILIDSLNELETLQKIVSAKTHIGIRINPFSSTWSKFGIHKKNIKIALEQIASSKNLELAGFHFHAGSFIHDPLFYKHLLNQLITIIKTSPIHYFNSITFINIGGGMPCYGKIKRNTLEGLLAKGPIKNFLSESFIRSQELQHMKHFEKLDLNQWFKSFAVIISIYMSRIETLLQKKVKLYLEPGTSLIGDAVNVYAQAVTTKYNKVLLDVGSNIEYDHNNFWHPIYNITSPSDDIQKANVFGPLCARDDLFARCYFGKPLKKGDYVKIISMGAYTFSLHTSFIKSRLGVVIKKNNTIKQTVTGETFENKYSSFF